MSSKGNSCSGTVEVLSGDGQDFPDERKRCAFCGKKAPDGVALIAGPHASICGACVEACMRLVEEHRQDE